METKWPDYWTGRALSIHSKLNTTYIRPVIAFEISKFLSVGAGVDFVSSDVIWKYQRIFTFQETGPLDIFAATSHSDVSAKGIGYVGGVLVRVSSSWPL
jgi:long-subunit fatty acid transport protein